MVRLLLVLTVLLSLALCTTPACGTCGVKADAVAETLAATNIGSASTTLNGRLTDMGDYKTVEVWFYYGPGDMSFIGQTPKQTMKAAGDFSAPTSAVTTGETYWFEAVAQGKGQSHQYLGDDLTFTVP